MGKVSEKTDAGELRPVDQLYLVQPGRTPASRKATLGRLWAWLQEQITASGKVLSSNDFTNNERVTLANAALRSELGTAAGRDATSGGSDTTPGRVMSVGACGVGGYVDGRLGLSLMRPLDVYGKGQLFCFSDGESLGVPGMTVTHYGVLTNMIDWTQTKLPPTAEEAFLAAKDALKSRATEKRWEVEVGGITINGMRVLTDTNDQNRITTVVSNARLAGIDHVDFKSASGWVTSTLDEVELVAGAVARHVQRCFSAERAHHEAIDRLQTLSEIERYDIEVGWA